MVGEQGIMVGSHGVTTAGGGSIVTGSVTFGDGGNGISAASGVSAIPINPGQKPSVKTANRYS
jgi:hypothetical protein